MGRSGDGKRNILWEWPWQNFWIFYFTSRLTLYECVVNVCIQRWFLIRNWTIVNHEVVRETGTKFIPKICPIVQFDTTPTQTPAQPQNCLCPSEVKYKTWKKKRKKTSFICMRIKKKIISTSIALHVTSLWSRGLRQLRNCDIRGPLGSSWNSSQDWVRN